MKKNYVKGILGALLGGLIASIPWILLYVYAMMDSLLAVLVAMGALKGYKLFKGEINEKSPLIIIIVSIVCITVSTLLIIHFITPFITFYERFLLLIIISV